jgi:hypothetical protein
MGNNDFLNIINLNEETYIRKNLNKISNHKYFYVGYQIIYI